MSVFIGKNKEDIVYEIREWLCSKQMNDLICAFSDTMPSYTNLEEYIDWLVKFSERWDYRTIQRKARDNKTGESARWLVDDSLISDYQKKVVEASIEDLGIIGITEPTKKDYDYIIALGGARYSCLFRPKYTEQLIAKYKINPKAVVMLSGMRPISESERSATDEYAPGAITEYDLMNAGIEKTYHVSKYEEEIQKNENINLSWAVRKYYCNDLLIASISAPSTEPEKRRANTADTYEFFTDRRKVRPGEKILAVTSQIYVPYQQLEAVRMLTLKHGIHVETVGFPTEWNRTKQGMMQASNYLQEIRSTILSINRFLNDIRSERRL